MAGGRWPPDTETLTRQSRYSVYCESGLAKAGGRSPKGPAMAGTTVLSYHAPRFTISLVVQLQNQFG